MSHPVGEQKSSIFGKCPVIEYQQELASIRAESLNRMLVTGRKIPQIAVSHISNENLQ